MLEGTLLGYVLAEDPYSDFEVLRALFSLPPHLPRKPPHLLVLSIAEHQAPESCSLLGFDASAFYIWELHHLWRLE